MVRGLRLSLIAMSLLCLPGVCLRAQGGFASPPRVEMAQRGTGTAVVTGTVLDSQTQHPVRLAQVSLVSTSRSNSGDSSISGAAFGGGAGARTGIDGRFVLDHIAEGDYYVIASADGYVSAQASVQAQVNAGVSQDDALRQVPSVHVATGGSAEITVSIERGAAIGGMVQWVDGVPATGLLVNYEATGQQASGSTRSVFTTPFGIRRMTTVDDRGQFRLSGLTPGDYIVQVSFSTFSAGSVPAQMRMYYPGVFRKSEAKPVPVRRGDERNDLQMTVDLSSLHTVSGTVSATSGGASIRSGTVLLKDSTDAFLSVTGSILSNGSFTVSYVPAGTYAMTVNGSSQEWPAYGRRNESGSVSFAPFTQTITVSSTDVTGLSINLSPSK